MWLRGQHLWDKNLKKPIQFIEIAVYKTHAEFRYKDTDGQNKFFSYHEFEQLNHITEMYDKNGNILF